MLIRNGRSDLLKLKNNLSGGSAVMYFEPGEDNQGKSHEVGVGVVTRQDSSKPGGIRYDFIVGSTTLLTDV